MADGTWASCRVMVTAFDDVANGPFTSGPLSSLTLTFTLAFDPTTTAAPDPAHVHHRTSDLADFLGRLA